MKVCLISPYSDVSAMGLRQLSACLKQGGHRTRLIFLPYLYPEIGTAVDFTHHYSDSLLTQVTSLCQDVGLIGISLMSNYFSMAEELTLHLKKELSVPVVWGGVHPSIRPEQCCQIADYVCVGEGDVVILELANALEQQADTVNIPGIWSISEQGTLVKNDAHPPVHDLDTLPYFDYDFDDHYVLDWEAQTLHPLTPESLKTFLTRSTPTKARASLFYQTITSRGCPYNCTFCCWNAYRTQNAIPSGVRRRSIPHVIGELKNIVARLDYIQEIVFSDDSFFAISMNTAEEFRDLYKSQVGLPFQCLADLRTINKKKMELFVDAGMKNIQIGIQTGSERINKLYGRSQKNEMVLEKTTLIHSYIPRIRPPIYDVILDNPWESREDKLKTLQLLLKIPRPYFLQLFSLTFFPGTRLFDKAMEEGIIKDERREVYDRQYNRRNITYLNVLFSLFSRPVPLPVLKFLSLSQVVRVLDTPLVHRFLGVLHWCYVRVRMVFVLSTR